LSVGVSSPSDGVTLPPRSRRHWKSGVYATLPSDKAADQPLYQKKFPSLDPRTPAPDRPGFLRRGHGDLRPRRLDSQGRRPRRRLGPRLGDLQVRGQPDLRRARYRAGGVPEPLARPHRVPLRVPRRHLSQGPCRAVVVATGVSMDGHREVLGCAIGDSEDGVFWTAFLRSLRARGLSGVRLVISDQHLGLKAAVDAVMVGSAGSAVGSTSCATYWPGSSGVRPTW
jgi:Transposase, Mutator family